MIPKNFFSTYKRCFAGAKPCILLCRMHYFKIMCCHYLQIPYHFQGPIILFPVDCFVFASFPLVFILRYTHYSKQCYFYIFVCALIKLFIHTKSSALGHKIFAKYIKKHLKKNNIYRIFFFFALNNY